MWNKPTEKQLSKIPRLYETESVPIKEKVIHMHFFLGGCDWYIAEHDPEEQILRLEKDPDRYGEETKLQYNDSCNQDLFPNQYRSFVWM